MSQCYASMFLDWLKKVSRDWTTPYNASCRLDEWGVCVKVCLLAECSCCCFRLIRMLDTYILLLKQHLQRMNVWLKMAESRIKQEGEIGPGYDDVKKQLEDHQVRILRLQRCRLEVKTLSPFRTKETNRTHTQNRETSSIVDRCLGHWKSDAIKGHC